MISKKKCSKCKVTKSLDLFYEKRAVKGGKMACCKKCHKAYNKEYRQTKEGKAIAIKAINKYRKSKKGKIHIKEHRQTEEDKAARKKFRQSEKGKLHSAVSNFKRRDKSYISKEILEKILSVYGPFCIYCNNELNNYSDDLRFKLTFDHIVPIVKSGTNDFHNIQKSSRNLKYYVKTYFPDSMDKIFEKLSLGNLAVEGM